MFTVLNNSPLPAGGFRFEIQAPQIAAKALPGQFVIVRLDEHGERIPLTIADFHPERGTITLFVQAVGKTSSQMSTLRTGDSILDIAGPLGNPSEIQNFGNVVLIGGGFGIAAIYPIARALTEAGNHTVSILGARTGNLIFLQSEMEQASSEVRIVTEDGSAGEKGRVTDTLKSLVNGGKPIHRVIAIGPLMMMQAVAEVTRDQAIPTWVSLNPIMIDGTGMCGACRVSVNGEMKFACVDGPEFDGHQVDFVQLLNRLQTYRPEEGEARTRWKQEHAEPCQQVSSTDGEK